MYNKHLKYEWDVGKRIANLAKHGIDFQLADGFDWGSALLIEDDREDYGEARFEVTGFIGDRLYVLIFTPRREIVRIISLRKANDREAVRYARKRQA